MKINWGTGIAIAIALFMSFIIIMVVKMSRTQTDLYSTDYYQQEVGYQEKIDATNNTKNLQNKFDVKISQGIIEVVFPDDLSPNDIQGNIHLYRPDNAKLDKSYTIKLDGNRHIIATKELSKGFYTLKVNCTSDNQSYYYEKDITVQ